MHGLEKIAPKAGSHALLIGAGPTGLMMAQFLYVGLHDSTGIDPQILLG